MENEKAQKQIAVLRQKINLYDHHYYVLDDPLVGDAEYDDLFQTLKKLETEHPSLISIDSPTQRVGGIPSSRFQRVQHRTKMLSLGNIYNKDALQTFHHSISKELAPHIFSYIGEPKFDGLALRLTYREGILVEAATRGDGSSGEDVTNNARTVRSIPLTLLDKTLPASIEVRGEICITKQDFLALNADQQLDGNPQFATARNAAAGSMRQLDPQITERRPLSFFAYALDVDDMNIETHLESYQLLQRYGFKTAEQVSLLSNVESCFEYYERLLQKRSSLNYDIDGIVLKLNEIQWRSELGSTARAPRWAVAFKFPPLEACTQIEKIEVRVGRTGVLTPVAHLETINIDGVQVRHATLHNFANIQRKDIRAGDYVWVRRAGEVIPEVIRVVLEKRPPNLAVFCFPAHCPSCHGMVKFNEHDIAYCDNARQGTCIEQKVMALVHFASKHAMDIDGLGEKLARQLVEKCVISNYADLYRLEKRELLTLDLVGERSAEKLLYAIKISKKKTLARLIFALGIKDIGREKALALAQYFSILERLCGATIEELQTISGISEKTAKTICDYFANTHNMEVVNALIHLGVASSHVESDILLPFSGKKALITGTLPNMTREQAEAQLQAWGCTITKTVTKKSDYIVVGDNPGSKYQKALDLGVKIIEQDIWMRWCDIGIPD